MEIAAIGALCEACVTNSAPVGTSLVIISLLASSSSWLAMTPAALSKALLRPARSFGLLRGANGDNLSPYRAFDEERLGCGDTLDIDPDKDSPALLVTVEFI